MLSQGGQESVPFELLIGVVLLGFVLLAGVVVLSQSSDARCRQDAKNLVESLRFDLESLFGKETSKKIVIQTPSCFKEKAQLFIKREDQRSTCALFCTGSNYRCFLVGFSTESFSEIQCLHIPSTAAFRQPSACPNNPDDAIPDDFEATELGFASVVNGKLENTIDDGVYVFSRGFDYANSSPFICSYRQRV